MATYTTEITSDKLISDNPIHQRLYKAYIVAKSYVSGNLLEIGCGEGRGVAALGPLVDTYHGIDKIGEILDRLKRKYPDYTFEQAHLPPLSSLEDASFDSVVSFQVIEHIEDDRWYLEEIYRVLKPGGKALISTPNIRFSLSRNPWHIREYTPDQLKKRCEAIFDEVETKGIGGNDKVWQYYEANKKSVNKITRWDFLNLQYRLPASLLKIPYELANRFNRNKLHQSQGKAVEEICHYDYLLVDNPEKALDLFYVLHKKSEKES
ncbi:class I SAM-dependent methyltransferase [Cyclobacterium jeungdonense]|uniref:Class I SAM-dependent methyltransferase n=1 Tax=Cyclobacterium jeungdonense TaxID=708087 RepID=A0ABT8CC65_9BACT|nr:class I SAM-dependent methyltransferase [Cyclobacterium jeungdonense]MDN3689403.1 class I SAM-dependent methyltransferase [Cyclobacterium jeungdonense]